MITALLDAARRYAEAHADTHGIATTPISGLTLIRETQPGTLQYAINKPLVALVLQGRKRVIRGSSLFDFGAGESLLIAADIPTISQIIKASAGVPYFSIVFELDPAVIEALLVEMDAAPVVLHDPIRIDPTEAEVSDAALRLLRLLDRPASMPVLQDQLVRELHYWLLSGRHGGAIRALGTADSHSRRIGRAITVIRNNVFTALRVEQLADIAGMSPSTFHEHFRAVTTLSPLQFQKHLRLIEARRILLSEGAMISHAAHSVGYESVPQFTREYGRMFGLPPARDIREARLRMQVAA